MLRLSAPTRTRNLRAAGIATIIVFASGFGVMSTLWGLTHHDPNLRGFTDYLSATWGDGLSLPLAIGASTYACLQLRPANGEKKSARSAGLIGALLGAGTQVLWLVDDAPVLNWTLTAPHHFNTAGVYHGAFVVCGAAYFAGVAALLVCRIRATPRAQLPKSVKVATATVLAAVTSFLILVTIDNSASSGTLATTATTAGVVSGVLLTAWLALRRKPLSDPNTTGAGTSNAN